MSTEGNMSAEVFTLLQTLDGCLAYLRRRLSHMTSHTDGAFQTCSEASTALIRLRQILAVPQTEAIEPRVTVDMVMKLLEAQTQLTKIANEQVEVLMKLLKEQESTSVSTGEPK